LWRLNFFFSGFRKPRTCQPFLSVNNGQGAGWIADKPFWGIASQARRFNQSRLYTDPLSTCSSGYTRLASLAMPLGFDRKLVFSSSGSAAREAPVHTSTQLKHISLSRQCSRSKLLAPAASVKTLRESDSESWPTIRFGRSEKQKLC